MKKRLYSFAMILVMMLVSLVFTACGDPKPTGIEIDKNSVDTTIEIGAEHILNNLKIIVTLDNGEKEEHTKNDKMEITEINTNQLGTQDLVVKYLGFEAKLPITVEEPGPQVATEDIVGYTLPEAYADGYLYQKGEAGEDIKDAINDKFFALDDQIYKVGNDNPFVFLPRVETMDENGDTTYVKRYLSDVTVKQGDTVLTGAALDEMVEIDNVNSSFQFSEDAEDEIFEITIKPDGMPDDATYDPITIVVQVVDGWNAYTEADLSRLDNCANTQSFWADYKAKNKIGNEKIAGLVLHKDMTLTKDHVPAGYLWEKGSPLANNNDGKGDINVDGSLKDSKSLYTLDIEQGEEFAIYGNYFSIKTQNEGPKAFPLVKYFQHDGQFGHCALLSVGGDNHYAPNDLDKQGKFYMENLSLKGNGSQAETSEVNRGGLTGIISSAKETKISNCLIRAFTTHITSLGTSTPIPTVFDNECIIEDSKLIDSYSTMFFAWASKENTIRNSVMKQAGGPLVIATHPWHEDHMDIYDELYSNVTVEDSILYAPVLGGEAWFNSTGAGSVMGTFNAFDMLFKDFSANYAGDDELDQNEKVVEKKSGFVGAHGEFNFKVVTMGEDSIANKFIIANKTIIKEKGQVVSEQDMHADFVAQFKAVMDYQFKGVTTEDGDEINPITSYPPLFKAGNVYITLDIASDEPDQGLALIIRDAELLNIIATHGGDEAAGAISQMGFFPLSLNGLESNPLYQALKEPIDAMLTEFFKADNISVFMGAQLLGATFEMFHLDV